MGPGNQSVSADTSRDRGHHRGKSVSTHLEEGGGLVSKVKGRGRLMASQVKLSYRGRCV